MMSNFVNFIIIVMKYLMSVSGGFYLSLVVVLGSHLLLILGTMIVEFFGSKEQNKKLLDNFIFISSFISLIQIIVIALEAFFSPNDLRRNGFIQFFYYDFYLNEVICSRFSIYLDYFGLFFIFFILIIFPLMIIHLFVHRSKERYDLGHIRNLYILAFLCLFSFTAGSDLINLIVAGELLSYFFIIYVHRYGGLSRRTYSSSFYLGITILSTACLITAATIYAVISGSSTIVDVDGLYLVKTEQISKEGLFLFFFLLGLAIKFPVFPFVNWLPEVHAEANTVGSVALAGLILKYPWYILLRSMIPEYFIFDLHYQLFSFFGVLALMGLIYVAGRVYKEYDIKRFIAYGSVFHMSMLLFVFTVAPNLQMVQGIVIGLVAHSLVVSLSFFLSGFLYHRYGTRNILNYKDVINFDGLSSITFLSIVMSASFPITLVFISELYLLYSVVGTSHVALMLLSGFIGLISGSAFFFFYHFTINHSFFHPGLQPLYLEGVDSDKYMRIFHENKDPKREEWDLSAGEGFICIVLMLLLVLFCFYSPFYLGLIKFSFVCGSNGCIIL